MTEMSMIDAYSNVPSFQFLPNYNGRLTLVKVVHLIFSPIDNVLGQPGSGRGTVINAWQPFFNPIQYHNEILDRERNINFPALRVLVLDFKQLELGEEAITVSEPLVS